MGQTVNLLAYAFGGSNPSLPTKKCGSSSVDRASAFQAEGREFEPRLPLYKESGTSKRCTLSFLFLFCRLKYRLCSKPELFPSFPVFCHVKYRGGIEKEDHLLEEFDPLALRALPLSHLR